jgi:hypothetical protein
MPDSADDKASDPRRRIRRHRYLGQAEAALARFAEYYNYHRLSGVLGWLTPGERFNGTPFTDRGFENVHALVHLQPWLEEVMSAA